MIPAPTTQNNQVTKIQMTWAPMDAIGCLDQAEWRKTTEYAPAVREVQHDANLLLEVNVDEGGDGNRKKDHLQK